MTPDAAVQAMMDGIQARFTHGSDELRSNDDLKMLK